MEQNDFSNLYIEPGGFLMCGEPDRSTSMVDGCRILLFNVENPSQFDFEIKFINDMNWLCNGYDLKRCSFPFQYR